MLAQFAVSELFAFLLIFTRVGTCIMLMPGIGEAYVMSRARLILALAISFLMTPLLKPMLPPVPGTPSILAFQLAAEATTGFFIGAIARIVISAMHTAGTIIATQSGLAMAMIFDVTQTTQSAVMSNLLVLLALVLFFAFDLHHLLLQGVVGSYSMFQAGQFLIPEDMAQTAVQRMSGVFAIALQVASPQIVIGLILYLGGGVLSRLMPTMQIFFIIAAPQILLSLFILFVTLGSLMLWYMQYVERSLTVFLGQ